MASRLRAITLSRQLFPHSFHSSVRLRSQTLFPAPRPKYFAYRMASLSTPPAGKYEWLVVIPDKPGMQQKRLEVRPKHLEGTKPLAESGFIKTGGALLNEKPEGDDASQFSFYGSTLVCVASSKEEIMELLSKDIYAQTGVWDLDNVQIWPAKFAFRNP
ncbi:hypothetical protein F5Y19DRAFT_470949 [Xylariaceae sp. FL1651]|nr:hypothetical protein F5Y19DRAFT_470949 [Xylariaceae sp. FL1651]